MSFPRAYQNGGGGGAPSGVQTITGLNVDNTDPLNPVISATPDGVVADINSPVAEAEREQIVLISSSQDGFGITNYLFHLSSDPSQVGTLAGQTVMLTQDVPLDLYLVGPVTEGLPDDGDLQHNGTVNAVHFTVTYDGAELVYNVVSNFRHHPGPGDFATRSFNSVQAAHTSNYTIRETNFDLLFGNIVANNFVPISPDARLFATDTSGSTGSTLQVVNTDFALINFDASSIVHPQNSELTIDDAANAIVFPNREGNWAVDITLLITSNTTQTSGTMVLQDISSGLAVDIATEPFRIFGSDEGSLPLRFQYEGPLPANARLVINSGNHGDGGGGSDDDFAVIKYAISVHEFR